LGDAGGRWVGLGDVELEIAAELRELVNVSADGRAERAAEAIIVEAAGPKVAGLTPGCRIDVRPMDRAQDC
jgi:hypothetical protein